jgi:hypothetical protein
MATGEVVANAVEPILQTVDTTVTSTIVDPGFLMEIGFGLLSLVIIITVHGWCMGAISKQFSLRFGRFAVRTRTWRVRGLMIVTITLLALTHFFETLIWAVPIWHFGLIPNFRDAYYFVLESYTTLGESTVTLPEVWRLGGPIIAISGLFTFSWTGSVLVYVVTETGRRHSHNGQRKSSPSKSKDHDATT